MDKIHIIQEALRVGQIPPKNLAEFRGNLAGEYSFHSGLLEEILCRKPAVWNTFRKDQKSDKATDRLWEATGDGINETGLRLKLKRLEKLMSGLKGLQDIAEGQARNQF